MDLKIWILALALALVGCREPPKKLGDGIVIGPPPNTGGSSFTPPTGTGFAHITGGALDSAAKTVDLASADITGILATGNQAAQALGGDLSGTTASATVAKLNGATISSAGGALTTGKVLRVTGASATDYGAVDLANSNAVTGVLPTGNQASQSLGGSLGGTTSSGTVLGIDGSGGTCSLATTAAIMSWASGSSAPTLKQADNTTNSATAQALTVQAANATGTAATGGNLVLVSGTGTSTAGSLIGKVGATAALQMGLASTDFIALGGATLGSTGQLRFPNNTVVSTARNAANGADITLIATNSSNNVYFGSNSGFSGTLPATVFLTGTTVALVNSGTVRGLSVTPTTVSLNDGTTDATINKATPSSDIATHDVVIQGQAPFASASSNKNPGNVVLAVASPVSGGTAGKVSCKVSGTEQFSIQSGTVDFANMTTTTTAPSAGGANALPGTPAGYMTVKIGGTNRQIAYY